MTAIGLLAPGGAFGEDAPGDLKLGKLGLSAIPAGLNKFNGFWSHTLLRDYGFADGQNPTLGYWVSAVVGIAVVGLGVFAIGKVITLVAGRHMDGSGSAQTAADSRSAPS
jgi:cobalt/nickel transport system permease protein